MTVPPNQVLYFLSFRNHQGAVLAHIADKSVHFSKTTWLIRP